MPKLYKKLVYFTVRMQNIQLEMRECIFYKRNRELLMSIFVINQSYFEVNILMIKNLLQTLAFSYISIQVLIFDKYS